ncbi:hypothetical protein GGF37_001247 [Kickxella alabastrina]|nr:hypothetical protein GGF37_001247 [Kickxella alabastrina]
MQAEAHYAAIVAHILGNMAQISVDPQSQQHRSRSAQQQQQAQSAQQRDGLVGLVGALDTKVEAELLAVRGMCAWLLAHLRSLLGERGRVDAARYLWSAWLASELPVEVRSLIEGNSSNGSSRSESMVNLAAAAATAVIMPWRTSQIDSHHAGYGGGEVALLIALHEWRLMLEDLGEGVSAIGCFSDPETVPLENLFGHPSEAVRVAAAAALRPLLQHAAGAEAQENVTARCLGTLVSRLQSFCAHCAVHSTEDACASADTLRRCIGYAYAIAAVVAMRGAKVPLDLLEWVHGISLRMLGSAYGRSEPEVVHHHTEGGGGGGGFGISSGDPADTQAILGLEHCKENRSAAAASGPVALRNMRMTVGWVLLTALAQLGPRFAQARVRAEWMPLWTVAMPTQQQQQVFVTSLTPWAERAHQLQSRTLALTHLLAAIRAGLVDSPSDVRVLVSCVRFTLMYADNALDAPLHMNTQHQQQLRMSIAAVDPTRPVWALPVPTALLTSHVVVRARAVECLRALGSRWEGALSGGVVPAAVRLVETVIGSSEVLSESMAQRISAACHPLPMLVPDHHSADTVAHLRRFRSGSWGYEIETGVTSLLPVFLKSSGGNDGKDLSSNRMDSDFGLDFACCAMSADEFDWTQAIFATVQPASSEPLEPLAPLELSRPPYTRLVDECVRLFGCVFPTMAEDGQLSLLDILVGRLNQLPFNSHRYLAVLTNIICALHVALQGTSEVMPRVARAVVEMTRAALVLPLAAHRQLAGEIIGLLATRTRDAASAYLPYLLEHLTQQAIRSRDRFARAGSAVALGSLYARAGSMVAGGHILKQVVVLLHSLASDKDPVVHTWAISALADAAMSAGYMFEPYARDTFKLALKLFLSDSHAVPMHASALWAGGKDHTPPNNFLDCAGSERVLPIATTASAAGFSHGSGSDAQRGVALGRDAAVTHPNSTTHHGRAPDGHRDDSHGGGGGGGGSGSGGGASGSGGGGGSSSEYRFVCARSDVDAHDARAALGHLVSSLILVFGPELQVDQGTRDSVLTLMGELRRSLPSLGVPVPLGDLSVVADPDAQWQTAAEYIFAVQKRLLFFPPPRDDSAYLPSVMKQTLRPIMQTRRRIGGWGDMAGLHSLQRVAVLALEGMLRLYGEDLVPILTQNGEWSLCDILWEALALHSAAGEHGGGGVSRLLVGDIRALVRTTVSLAVCCEYRQMELGSDTPGVHALVSTLCAVFIKRSGAQPTLAAIESEVTDGTRPFDSLTRQLSVAALVSILDAIATVRPLGCSEWRAHPLTDLLTDLLRVSYMAATTPVDHSPGLCVLGQSLLQRLLRHFADVEDPAVPGEDVSVLAIYQAQISSAFLPALQMSGLVRVAAMETVTAYVLSGLVSNDRASAVRMLRLVAPQPVFARVADGMPEQCLVVEKLAVLGLWATIYARRDVLGDVVMLHMDVLCQGWLDAVRDMAVLDMDLGDVYRELDRLTANTRDVGLGLCLGLESTYVGLVRDSLSQWYAYYLPRFVSALTVALSTGDTLMRNRGKAKYRPMLLLMGFALQHLAAVPKRISSDVPPVRELADRMVGALDLGNSAAVAYDKTANVNALLDCVCALLDHGLEFGLLGAFGPADSSAHMWLASEVWRRAVAPQLADNSNRALKVALALVRQIDRSLDPSGRNLLAHWLFDNTAASDSEAEGALLGLSVCGRAVLRDLLATWRRTYGQKESYATALACLNVLGRIPGCAAAETDTAVDGRAMVSMWLGLWHKSLVASQDAHGLARALMDLLGRVSAKADDDLITRGELALVWAGDMVNSMLAQMLVSESSSEASVGVVAALLSVESCLAISAQVQALFVSAYVRRLSEFTRNSAQNSDLPALLAIPKALNQCDKPLGILPVLARQAIPHLARLVHAHLSADDTVLELTLGSLTELAMSKRYPDGSGNSGDMVMAATLMLFLSLCADDKSGRIADGILALATGAPLPFKNVVLRLAATQPLAKSKLEAAIRSRVTKTAKNEIERAVQKVEEAPSRIALKSSFAF